MIKGIRVSIALHTSNSVTLRVVLLVTIISIREIIFTRSIVSSMKEFHLSEVFQKPFSLTVPCMSSAVWTRFTPCCACVNGVLDVDVNHIFGVCIRVDFDCKNWEAIILNIGIFIYNCLGGWVN